MPEIVVALIVGLGSALVVTIGLAQFWLRPAVQRAKQEAIRESELRANAAILQAKESALEQRERLEDEIRQKQASLSKQEDRLIAREEMLEGRRGQLDEREVSIAAMSRSTQAAATSIASKYEEIEAELQRIAGLTREDAREVILNRFESEFAEIGVKKAKQFEVDALADADRRAKQTVLDVIQRSVVDYVTEATLAVVELPSEDMKGRISGREGRNIRAFEQVTGVDLIVDETPEAVVISCFDPVRRETARLALMNLMVDGRIHPGRIEELYEKAQQEVDRMIKDAGERACDRANVHGLHPRAVEVLGRLRFRTSYAQNVLDHSVEVSRLCGNLAAELGLSVEVAKRAGLLHDIGKALGPEWEGPHALTGMEFLRGLGEKEVVLNPVGAHHHEIEPETPEAQLVIIADTISAARPGARRENLENYVKRLTALEQLANSFPGVERSYALQAGREIRMIVKPEELDDLAAMRLANDVAKRIEAEMEYPGQIKVTVIRETRATDIAK
ncbi:MAG: ribonuclease Y [Fimbriimonadaceae bacterium]|nr:ribonuclease Y [Fimbriimonadaceae bacterium]